MLDRLYRGDDHDPALEAAAFPSPKYIECVKWFDARLLGQFRRTGLTRWADRSRPPPALPSNDQAARIEQQGVEREEQQNKKKKNKPDISVSTAARKREKQQVGPNKDGPRQRARRGNLGPARASRRQTARQRSQQV